MRTHLAGAPHVWPALQSSTAPMQPEEALLALPPGHTGICHSSSTGNCQDSRCQWLAHHQFPPSGEAWGCMLQEGVQPRQAKPVCPSSWAAVWETSSVITYAPNRLKNEEVGPACQVNFSRRLESKGEDNYSLAKHVPAQVPLCVQPLEEALPVQSFVCSQPSTEHCLRHLPLTVVPSSLPIRTYPALPPAPDTAI